MKQKLLSSFRLRVVMLVALLTTTLSSSLLAQQTITFDFEDNSAHRTSGNNSYSNTANTYSENDVSISLTYADAVTTGTPLDGSANIQGRIAKNSTNSPVVKIGAINLTDATINSISYKIKGVAAMSMKVEYSTDDTNWTTIQTLSPMPTSSTEEKIEALNIEGNSSFYLRLVVSVSKSTNSARDFQLDDISISYSSNTSSLIDSDLALTGAPVALSFDLYNNSSAQTINYTTSSTGAVTVSESEYVTTTVDATNKTITVTPVKKTPSTQTITVSQAADDNYAAGSATFTVSVVNSNEPGSSAANPYTVAQAIAATPSTGTSANVYIHGIVSSFYNNNSNVTTDSYHRYYISDDGTKNSQLLVFNGKGLNNNPFSSADDLMIGDEITIYGGLTTFSNASEVAKDNYIVSLVREKKDPTIVVNKTETVAYGSIFTVDDSMIEGGEITVTSSNTAVATVSGLVITPVAVGTTTITVATAESASYNAGSETFTLTVTQPAGGTSVPVDGYVKVTNSSDLTDGEYLIVYESGNVAFNGGLETLDAQGNYISVSISDNTIASSTTVDAATFIVAAVEGGYSIKSASGKYIGRTATSNGFNSSATEAYKNTITFNKGNAVITSSGGPTLQYYATSGQERFRYYTSSQKSISLYKKVETTLTVKLNGFGYATYCSEYPLDFTNAEGYTAWQITGVSGEAITFEKVTGAVKGGTGLLLKGEAGATVTLASANSTNTLADNLLEGTLAPIYVADNEYYGLSGNQFVKVNAGTVPAGKALLDAVWVSNASGARLSFVFEDDNTTTGISEELRVKSEESFYNLNGQRVNDLKKGGLYIVGGKKVIVK